MIDTQCSGRCMDAHVLWASTHSVRCLRPISELGSMHKWENRVDLLQALMHEVDSIGDHIFRLNCTASRRHSGGCVTIMQRASVECPSGGEDARASTAARTLVG